MADRIAVTIEASSLSLLPGTKLSLISQDIVYFISANEDGTGIVEINMVDGTKHYVKETLDEVMEMLNAPD